MSRKLLRSKKFTTSFGRQKFLDVKIADGESFTDLLGVPLTMLNKRREIEKIDNAQPKLKLQHLPKVQDDFKNINVGMTDSCAALLAPLWSEVLHLHHCCVVERLQFRGYCFVPVPQNFC